MWPFRTTAPGPASRPHPWTRRKRPPSERTHRPHRPARPMPTPRARTHDRALRTRRRTKFWTKFWTNSARRSRRRPVLGAPRQPRRARGRARVEGDVEGAERLLARAGRPADPAAPPGAPSILEEHPWGAEEAAEFALAPESLSRQRCQRISLIARGAPHDAFEGASRLRALDFYASLLSAGLADARAFEAAAMACALDGGETEELFDASLGQREASESTEFRATASSCVLMMRRYALEHRLVDASRVQQRATAELGVDASALRSATEASDVLSALERGADRGRSAKARRRRAARSARCARRTSRGCSGPDVRTARSESSDASRRRTIWTRCCATRCCERSGGPRRALPPGPAALVYDEEEILAAMRTAGVEADRDVLRALLGVLAERGAPERARATLDAMRARRLEGRSETSWAATMVRRAEAERRRLDAEGGAGSVGPGGGRGWVCGSCRFDNYGHRTECLGCRAERFPPTIE